MSNDMRDMVEIVCMAIIVMGWVAFAIGRFKNMRVMRDVQRGRERIAYLDGQQAMLNAIKKSRQEGCDD